MSCETILRWPSNILGQVQCIFLRNTSATDPKDKFPYNTQGFKDLNTEKYMFFKVPDDLKNLDIVGGAVSKCDNTTERYVWLSGVAVRHQPGRWTKW